MPDELQAPTGSISELCERAALALTEGTATICDPARREQLRMIALRAIVAIEDIDKRDRVDAQRSAFALGFVLGLAAAAVGFAVWLT